MTQPSNAEVGWADNGPQRLPNTVQPEPTRGDDPYGTSNFAKSTVLDPADTAGVVGQPTVGAGYGMPSLNANVDVHNSDTSLNTTASTENLSAKFKAPNVSQDYPAAGGPARQFNDHN